VGCSARLSAFLAEKSARKRLFLCQNGTFFRKPQIPAVSENFLDDKSNGFQVEDTGLETTGSTHRPGLRPEDVAPTGQPKIKTFTTKVHKEN
jgi:hypothetical protein